MHWKTPDAQVQAHYSYSHAHAMMDALIAGGWTESQAKQAVEQLWNNGRSEGYEDGLYDAEGYL